MTRLAWRMAVADLRRSPGRSLAVAGLLLAAALLPAMVRPGSVVGLVLAVVVAASATAGTAAQHERRTRILTESGAEGGTRLIVAMAGLVGPGLVAAGAATAVGLVSGGDPSPGQAVALALVVPVVAAAVTTWTGAPGARLGRRGTAAVAVLVAVTAPLLVVPLVVLAVAVGPRLGRARLPVRIGVSLLAVAVTVGAAAALGLAETFLDLGLLLLVTAVPLTFAVGWLGATAVAATATVVGRTGPTARLATAPLGRRRRQLGPVAAVVAVVATLAAAEGVVGASFEAREDRRLEPRILGLAGTRGDQVIAVTTGLAPDEERGQVAEAVGSAPLRIAVIDRIGGGGTGIATDGFLTPVEVIDDREGAPVPPEVAVATGSGPAWVGVVGPDALGPLGLDAHAEALARGDALILDPGTRLSDGQVEVTGGAAGPLVVPAVVVSERAGVLLPAALVSEARATELGGTRNGARTVVVPAPGADPELARAAAERVHAGQSDLGRSISLVGEVLGTEDAVVAAVEHRQGVASGNDPVREPDVAPLDEVPLLARTADAGQQQAIGLGGLAVLVALAGTLLVVGGARSEDAVLLVQGAPARLRVATAVVQTATVAAAGTALGAVVGLGVPGVGFAVYNARPRDARTVDVPYVLPPALVVLLVGVPVAAASLAAVVVAARGRPTPSVLADAARG